MFYIRASIKPHMGAFVSVVTALVYCALTVPSVIRPWLSPSAGRKRYALMSAACVIIVCASAVGITQALYVAVAAVQALLFVAGRLSASARSKYAAPWNVADWVINALCLSAAQAELCVLDDVCGASACGVCVSVTARCSVVRCAFVAAVRSCAVG